MGSIQSLRSLAMADRAKSDTKLQVSGYLSTVNKSLGSQVSDLIDGLQGVIGERTKAYNALVAKLNQSINGKGGIGDQSVQWTFTAAKAVVSSVSSTIAAASAIQAAIAASKEAGTSGSNAPQATANTSKAGPPLYDVVTAAFYATAATIESKIAASKNATSAGTSTAGTAAAVAAAGEALGALTTLVSTILQGTSISKSIESATYDYKKMTTQLGYTSETTDNGDLDATASKLLELRDSMMLRYKPKQFSVAAINSSYTDPTNRGYAGTLERI